VFAYITVVPVRVHGAEAGEMSFMPSFLTMLGCEKVNKKSTKWHVWCQGNE